SEWRPLALRHRHVAQALAAAGFGHVASVERERDKWKAAWDMADPILTERDALCARVEQALAWIRGAAHECWGEHNAAAEMGDLDAANRSGDVAEALDEIADRLHAALDGEATP